MERKKNLDAETNTLLGFRWIMGYFFQKLIGFFCFFWAFDKN